jgi:hypothetical protein
VVAAILCAVHVLRSGQDRWWLLGLFLFPLLGSFVYVLVVVVPSLTTSRRGRRGVRGLRDTLDPGRELRDAQAAFEHSPTIAHRIRLADAQHSAGRFEAAIATYRDCLRGVHADDADIQVKLARSLLEDGQHAQARELLEALIQRQPDFKSPDGHLVYARAVAASGDRARAAEEFDALIGYYAGIEPRARYVEILRGWGELAAAERLREDSLRHIRHMPASARRLNETWIRRLKTSPRPVAGA